MFSLITIDDHDCRCIDEDLTWGAFAVVEYWATLCRGTLAESLVVQPRANLRGSPDAPRLAAPGDAPKAKVRGAMGARQAITGCASSFCDPV
jgi:hypothetical protein